VARGAPCWRRLLRPRPIDCVKGRCYVLLHQPEAAQPLLQEALSLRDRSHVRGRAVMLFDLATTYVHQRDLDMAAQIAGEAITLSAEHRITSVTECTRRFQAELRPWSTHPVIKDLDDQLQLVV
jgi:hypothetical protein